MTLEDRRLLAGALLALALSAAGLAAAATWLAAGHMAAIAALCGPQAPHCGWCVVALAAATGSAAALAGAFGLLRGPLPARLRVRG
ncbi:hypothetical protein [Brevundimonas sp.]|uniref:hypothetical protein n=1 Tax=Brevundimonas sp. TaxID=1871086 RepID=UPI0035B26F82